MTEKELSQFPQKFQHMKIPNQVLDEAKKRVLDAIGCYFGAFDHSASRKLRKTFIHDNPGTSLIWGTKQKVAPLMASWIHGTGVRALDFNDTYLSLEPCHPSDLLSSLWAGVEIHGGKNQGQRLLKSMILAYDVLCRLCDSGSIRKKGWDHVTYLPIASAIGCSTIFGLNQEKTRHAISLSIVGHIALRQTRVGTISDWKAACASYGARAGLWAAQLAYNGFTGPADIFSGKHGFLNQVSGRLSFSNKNFGRPWKIMKTHTKFFPAEHHSQSAIEAALFLHPQVQSSQIQTITVETFDVAVDIIGSEPEKWIPKTRETADHSMAYLVAVALIDGTVNLKQYQKKRYLSPAIIQVMKKIKVKNSKYYSRIYPEKMPTRLIVKLKNGKKLFHEVILPKGYAGKPMTWEDVSQKFEKMTDPILGPAKTSKFIDKIGSLERIGQLKNLSRFLS